MTTAIERFKRRRDILEQVKPVTPAKPKKARKEEPVDEAFVNAPGIYDKEIKVLKAGTKKLKQMLKK